MFCFNVKIDIVLLYMAVSDLKNKVKDRIESVNDVNLLEEILNLIDFQYEKEEYFNIPHDHKRELEISLRQMENRDITSNDDVKIEVQKWLSK